MSQNGCALLLCYSRVTVLLRVAHGGSLVGPGGDWRKGKKEKKEKKKEKRKKKGKKEERKKINRPSFFA